MLARSHAEGHRHRGEAGLIAAASVCLASSGRLVGQPIVVLLRARSGGQRVGVTPPRRRNGTRPGLFALQTIREADRRSL